MKNIFITLLLSLSAIGFSQTPTFLSTFEDQNLVPEYGDNYLLEDADGTLITVANPDPDARNNSSYVLKAYTAPNGIGRAEYTAGRYETNEKKYIYAWKRYHATDMLTDVSMNWNLINQWKTWPCPIDENDTLTDYICYPGGGIFNDIRFDQNDGIEYLARALPDCYTDLDTIEKGIWNDFVLEVYWTNTSTGYYRIWKNDELFGSAHDIKTLFDGFREGECDMNWSNGIYSYWTQTGGNTQDELAGYIDDIAIYDIDSGYTINDICPDCEDVGDASYCDTVTFSAIDSITDAYTNDGAIYQTVISPQSVTHLWNTGATTEDLTGLVAGTYTDSIVMVDSGCYLPKTYIVAQLDPCDVTDIIITGNITDAINDEGGAIDIVITGDGTSPYTYLWSNSATTQNISNLSSGNYSVTVTDDNSCTNDSTFTVANVLNDTLADSTFTLTVLEQSINLDTIPLEGLDKNSIALYYINEDVAETMFTNNALIIWNTNPCDTTTILISSTIVASDSANGSITLDISGGASPYTYLWSPGGEITKDITDLTPGVYSVVVTDDNGCTGNDSFVISLIGESDENGVVIYIEPKVVYINKLIINL